MPVEDVEAALQALRDLKVEGEHNRIRQEVFAPISETVERVQFHVPD